MVSRAFCHCDLAGSLDVSGPKEPRKLKVEMEILGINCSYENINWSPLESFLFYIS